MIVPHPTLGDREVDVNGTQAKTDFLGPAVVPQLPSYYVHRVTMDVPDVPPGYDLGDQIVNVEPSYRSGTVVPIGTGATAVVEGVLVDDAGKPITLQVGSIVSLDLPGRAPTGFFTNSAGRFQLVGLIPGRYELTLAAAPSTSVRFSVPAGASGTFGLGTVVFPLEGTQ